MKEKRFEKVDISTLLFFSILVIVIIALEIIMWSSVDKLALIIYTIIEMTFIFCIIIELNKLFDRNVYYKEVKQWKNIYVLKQDEDGN